MWHAHVPTAVYLVTIWSLAVSSGKRTGEEERTQVEMIVGVQVFWGNGIRTLYSDGILTSRGNLSNKSRDGGTSRIIRMIEKVEYSSSLRVFTELFVYHTVGQLARSPGHTPTRCRELIDENNMTRTGSQFLLSSANWHGQETG
ncbi:hypothetical protein RRG08_013306 [Elysia crispata]|uniref:Secreted protein n=1 Tax=Elysia crispata TaxID=231223 RepID=A0AAE1AYG6_9GAST|nr:hypothetical protein RRG08_013306 [Elysia crispata]